MQQVTLDQPITPDSAVLWQDDCLYLLDQRVLPAQECFVRCTSAQDTAEAIRSMVVRGAPAIGVAAAFGAVLALREAMDWGASWRGHLAELMHLLGQARPTAVNLSWALNRMQGLAEQMEQPDWNSFLREAQAIHAEDVAANRMLGDLGAHLIEQPTSIITHCNAGALATGGYGTALGVVRSAFAQGKVKHVFADETRPWLQGARLTAWELQRDGIPVSLLVDGAAASRLAAGGIGWVVVGADRIAANGDVANKIGTYGLALAARYHGVKFMVAAPTSTIDMNIGSGAEIPIEVRDGAEILSCGGQRMAAQDVGTWNPVFDVTPAALVDAIVTERGVVLSPDADKMRQLMQGS